MKLYLVFQLIVINLNKLNGWGCGSFKGLKYHSHDRIVSGYDVGYHKFPWYAALYEYSTDVACGGALIGPKTVVTAAHCFREKLKLAAEGKFQLENLYRVKIGVYNNCNPHDTSQIFNVSKVVVHKLYQKHDPYYDIAMLTLSDIAFNVPPICLPEKPMRKRPKVAIVTGLGTVRFKGSEPCTLKEARILTYSDQECRKMLNASEGTGNKLDKAFCAGYLQGGIDTCQGDSGGPLQILNKNGDYVLLGVVSFGYKCALPKMLGVYTDVSHYLDWIKENSGLSAKIVKEIYRPRPGPNQIGLHQQQSLYYIPPFRPAKIIVP